MRTTVERAALMRRQLVVADSYLTLHYSVGDLAGNEYVSTFDLSPATFQLGSGQLAEPFERCLLGMSVGEHRVFELADEEAFGARNPRLVERIARSALPADVVPEVGTLLEFTSPEGVASFAGIVREQNEKNVLVDFNHPLAGKAVRFAVQVIAIL